MLFVYSVLLNFRRPKKKSFGTFNNSLKFFLPKPFLTHSLIYCITCVRERHIFQHSLQVASKLKYPACKILQNTQNKDTVWSSLEYSSLGNSLGMAVKPVCFPSKQKSSTAVKQMWSSHPRSSQSKCSHCLGYNNCYMYPLFFIIKI